MSDTGILRVDHLTGKSPIPGEVAIDPKWGENFSREWGVTIEFSPKYSAHVFLDKRLTQGSAHEDILQVLGTESIGAHIVTCEKGLWEVRVEPTDEGRFGLAIYTAAGKAIMAGEGTVEKTQGGGGSWKAQVKPLYPGIRNKKKVSGQVGIRGGTGQPTEIQGGVTIHF